MVRRVYCPPDIDLPELPACEFCGRVMLAGICCEQAAEKSREAAKPFWDKVRAEGKARKAATKAAKRARREARKTAKTT